VINLQQFIELRGISGGGYEIVNPFLLIFAITYALLYKAKILSKYRGINVTIAVVVGLVVVIPHVMGRKPDIVPWLNAVLPYFALLLVFILSIFLLLALFGWTPSVNTIISIISIIIIIDVVTPDILIIALLGRYAPFDLPNWLAWTQADWILPTVIISLVFAGLVWWITREPNE